MPRDEARAMPLDSPASQEVRTPPASLEAEQAFLGALLTNNRVYDQVGDFLRPEHFIHPAHALIYETCQQLIDRGRPANPITLRPVVEREEDLFAEAGGVRYLAALVGSMVSTINGPEYARLIADCAHKRALIQIAYNTLDQAYINDIDVSAETIQARAEADMLALVTSGASDQPRALADYLDAGLAEWEEAHRRGETTGLRLGLTDFDRITGGLRPSELWILAGRPGMAKSLIGATMGRNVAAAGLPVALFSMEMDGAAIARRLLSAAGNLNGMAMRRGQSSSEDIEAAVTARDRLRGLPLIIDERAAHTVASIMGRCRRIARQHKGLALVIVDYLQLIQTPRAERRGENKTAEITDISRGLKMLAKELKCPVLALSQLSRAVESRENKRPQLSDLRESGAIEQDADGVVFILREEYYLGRDEPTQRSGEAYDKYLERYKNWADQCQRAKNVAELIVAKQRDGATGAVRVFCDTTRQRVEDMAREEPS